MCGIAGFWTTSSLDHGAAETLCRMTDALRHRGPDDNGSWLDPNAGLALGHRRLSIIDLSPLGHQPMASRDGRWVIALNGEIYNFPTLRAELANQGVSFRGHSDTEVLLEAVAHWGLSRALDRAAGMFALVLWDREARKLFLVRDRLGEKPLYFGRLGNTWLFGSELKALRAHPHWSAEIDRDALTLFLRFNYVPAPLSIYRGIRKLRPAHVATLSADGQVQEQPYWSLADVVERGRAHPLAGTDEELVSRLEERLQATIREQMVSDVPLGALLSGGIDSSAVVAMMQAESSRPIKTFTIGFHESSYNEAQHAKSVARHLGTEHTELYVTPEEARAVIPRLPSVYDEPFGDSSQIPTMLVAELTRRHVTVALSGDGGDEMFGGYNRYFLGHRIWRQLSPVPRPLRQGLAAAIRAVPPSVWGRALAVGLPRRFQVAHAGDRMHKLADILGVRSAAEMYRALVSHWRDPASVVRDGHEAAWAFDGSATALNGATFVERMMFVDARTYLPDDIMVKVDRAAMAVSLESRAPFLDHRVAELAWRLPLDRKVRGSTGKWALRAVLDRYVPRELVERPKMGFGIPLDSWLRGPLKEWAGDLLAPGRIDREGFLVSGEIERKWREHQSGLRNWQYLLWDVLMFQAWLAAEHQPLPLSGNSPLLTTAA